jgi:hypothetical protein
MALDEMRPVAISMKKVCQLLIALPPQNRRIVDLVPIQMQDGKDCPIPNRIQKFVRMPACGERARFGFTVTHHTANQQIRIVQGGPVSVGDGVAQLASLVNRPGGFRSDVAGDSPRKRKLSE